MEFARHPQNAEELMKQLKEAIDLYWSYQLPEDDLREIVTYYARQYGGMLFRRGQEKTMGYTTTTYQRLGKRRLEIISKLLNVETENKKTKEELEMMFLNEEQREKFDKLIKKGNIQLWDVQRTSLMYILSCNNLFPKAEKIYDFKKNTFNTKILENCPYSTSEEKLVRAGYNLFTGKSSYVYKVDGQEEQIEFDIFSIYYSLDTEHIELLTNAIKLRFGRN